MPGILPHLICAALYAAIALLLYRSLAQQNKAERTSALLHWATLLPLLLHTWLLHRMVFAPDGIYLGVGTSVSVIIWLTVLIYWFGSFFYRLQGLQVFILGAAAVLVLLPALCPRCIRCPTPSWSPSACIC